MSLVGRILRLASFVAFLVAIADRPDLFAAPEDLYIDWPLDAMTRGGPGRALVMGHNVYVQQNFRSTTNLQFPDQEHTGLDLQLDSGGRDTENAIVRAVTDGIVECIDARRWGTQGDVIVIKHDDELYSVYGHLPNVSWFVEGREFEGASRSAPSRGGLETGTTLTSISRFASSSIGLTTVMSLSKARRNGQAKPSVVPVRAIYRGEFASLSFSGVRTWVDPVDFYFDHRPFVSLPPGHRRKRLGDEFGVGRQFSQDRRRVPIGQNRSRHVDPLAHAFLGDRTWHRNCAGCGGEDPAILQGQI